MMITLYEEIEAIVVLIGLIMLFLIFVFVFIKVSKLAIV